MKKEKKSPTHVCTAFAGIDAGAARAPPWWARGSPSVSLKLTGSSFGLATTTPAVLPSAVTNAVASSLSPDAFWCGVSLLTAYDRTSAKSATAAAAAAPLTPSTVAPGRANRE